jgi:hypothetical protein
MNIDRTIYELVLMMFLKTLGIMAIAPESASLPQFSDLMPVFQ